MIDTLLPEYQAVYVISDLHLGGFDARHGDEMRDYRIFRDGEALAWFVRETAIPRAKGDRIALVINGDLVDFLALEDATYFDWRRADEKLQRVLDDKAFTMVWDALAEFVAQNRGDLVIVLGNHDLELALPVPQQRLHDRLAGRDPARRGRVIFAIDGSGFSCMVGGRRILCVHGNEVDPWNAIDWGRLAFIRRALTRGSLARDQKLMDNWVPNPGTQLVIEHLNRVKRQFQWVDLLKPEEEGAAMVAAALTGNPGLRTFAQVMWDQRTIRKRLEQGFMGATRPGAADVLPTLQWRPTTKAETDAFIGAAVESVARGDRPVDLVDAGDEFLMGTAEMLYRTIKLKVWPSSLRETLETTLLADDETFNIATPDETFHELDAVCSDRIHFVVSGHTHLQRALTRDAERGTYYFNSGTWIRLARIPRALLTPAAFEPIELRLIHGSMRRLEEEPKLILSIRTVVKIVADPTCGARGALFTVDEQSNGGWTMTPVPGSARPRPAAGAEQ